MIPFFLPLLSFMTIPTLVDQRKGKEHIVGFCPICDQEFAVADTGAGRDETTAACAAKVRLHIQKVHRSKSVRPGATGGIR